MGTTLLAQPSLGAGLLASYRGRSSIPPLWAWILIDFLSKTELGRNQLRATKRRFKFDWAGGMAGLKDQFTAVELQHHLNEMR
jgi:hypothetical protein